MSEQRDIIQHAIDTGSLESYQLQGILLYRHLYTRFSDPQEAWSLASEMPLLFFTNEIQNLEVVSSVEFDDVVSDDYEESVYWLHLRSDHMRVALCNIAMQPEEIRFGTQAQIEGQIDRFMQVSYLNDLKKYEDGYSIMFSDYSSTYRGGVQKIDCYSMIKAYKIIEELNDYILSFYN